MNPPNGWFANGLLVWNELDDRGFVSKGYLIQSPDLRSAPDNMRVAWSDAIRLFVHSLEENTRCQFSWTVDSDYKAELLAYDAATDKLDCTDWERHTRRERFTRYWNAMEDRELRRENLVIWLSKKITTSPPSSLSSKALVEHQRKTLIQISETFEHLERVLESCLEPFGAAVIPMGDEANYRYIAKALNPSFMERFDFDPIKQFDPFLSIQENCWHSPGQGGEQYGFFSDDHYHNIITLKRIPQRSSEDMIDHLTSLPFLNYRITVNLYPKPVRKEIDKEEKSLERVRGDYASEAKHSDLTKIRVKQHKIENLSSGAVYPFDFHCVIHIWAKTLEELSSKSTQIKTAINAMSDAQYQDTVLPAMAKNLWLQTWPGWLWGNYMHHKQYGDDSWLVDMLPASAAFTGNLDGAEAIYEGANRNLVGVTTFKGYSPQHTALFGMSGSGKSAYMCDLLSQIGPYYRFRAIIEEGLTYGTLTKTYGQEPIIIHPDGDLTINYLDTRKSPISRIHLSSAAAMVAKMTGLKSDEDRQNLRTAQILQYIQALYTDIYQDWTAHDPQRIAEVAKVTMLTEEYRVKKMPTGSSFVEAWAEVTDLIDKRNDELLTKSSKINEGQVTKFLKDPATENLVRDAAFAFFEPAEYPTHSMLQEFMKSNRMAEHNKSEINDLATLMEPWNAGGSYGCLFDGTSNVDLTGKIAHFELGYIPKSAEELKTLVGFLITNQVRQHIMTLPRGDRKCFVFEEAARLMSIKGGEGLIQEAYAQMRKFNCWVISIVQQYSMFANSTIRPVVMGNSSQFFLLRQNDRSDVDNLSEDIKLPEPTKEAIMRYPLPAHQKEGKKFSTFTYYSMGQNAMIGTVRNVISPEMHWCSTSNGNEFEERSRILKANADKPIVDTIIEQASLTANPNAQTPILIETK